MKVAYQYLAFAVGAMLIYLFIEICFALAMPKGEISVPIGWIVFSCLKFAVAAAISFFAVALFYKTPRKARESAVIFSGLLGGLLSMFIFSSVNMSNFQAALQLFQFTAGAVGIPIGYWLGLLKVR